MSKIDPEGGQEDAGSTLESPLRILHILAAGPYGGLESVVQALSEGLLQAGHACQVLAIVDGGEEPDPFELTLRDAGVPVTVLRQGNRAYFRERRELLALCRKLRPDIVHSHGYRADVQLISLGRKLGVPIVSTVHGFTGGGFKMSIYERLQEYSLRRAAGIAAVSRPIADRLTGAGVDSARIRWIANAWVGAKSPAGRAEARRVLGLDPDAVVVGWVGRLSREKGADILLEALPALDLPRSVVCFVGDGPEQERLCARVEELGVSARVHFTGAIREAGRLFSAFDLFCLSSRTEGTPMVLLEAITAGVPVVATRVGGVPDVVGDAEALVVEPEDVGALGSALRQGLIGHAAAVERAGAARRRLERDFSVGPWVARYEDLYRSVLQE